MPFMRLCSRKISSAFTSRASDTKSLDSEGEERSIACRPSWIRTGRCVNTEDRASRGLLRFFDLCPLSVKLMQPYSDPFSLFSSPTLTPIPTMLFDAVIDMVVGDLVGSESLNLPFQGLSRMGNPQTRVDSY